MNAMQFQQKILGMQEKMMNFALMLTMDKSDAQDLLQDTTLKVLHSQDKFVDNVNFKGWVLTIMRNTFINNYHKVVRAQMVVDVNTDLHNLDIVCDSGIGTPEGDFQLKEITGVMNKMNDELRIPWEMYLSGYKYNEISDALNVPLGTVKSRIFFARKRLQYALKDIYC